MRGVRLAFVVGTGRCGSTMLGDLLGDHPGATTVNEHLATAEPGPLPDEVITGTELVRALGRPHPVLSLLVRHGVDPVELRYPIDAPGSRFDRSTGLPGLLAAAIPAVTEEPDAAWDQLCRAAATWPSSDGAGHFRALAAWFARAAGAPVVVERSGGSLRFAESLVAAFPDARFVHIHRDGEATARSMARHPFFQLVALRRHVCRVAGHDPFDPSLDRTARDELDALIPGLTPWRFDAERFRAQPPLPPAVFGALWSSLLHSGMRALRRLPRQQVLHVDYRSLCASPRPELGAVAEFLGLEPDSRWLSRSADRVHRPHPPEAAHDRRLVRACAPGEAVRRTLTSGSADVADRSVVAAQR